MLNFIMVPKGKHRKLLLHEGVHATSTACTPSLEKHFHC